MNTNTHKNTVFINNIDWNLTENIIKEIKYPLAFIFKLSSILKKNINYNDYHISIIIRFFFKYHNDIIIKYPLFKIIDIIHDNYIISKKTLKDFYILIKKKYALLILIEEWKLGYNKKLFWTKNIEQQIQDLISLESMILANFDCFKGNIPLHYKLITNANNNNKFILNNLKIRLRNIYTILGYTFFLYYKILVIDSQTFDGYDFNEKINYSNYIFIGVKTIINNILNNFKVYFCICKKLNNLINPIPIQVKFDSVHSEIEFEDLLFLIEN